MTPAASDPTFPTWGASPEGQRQLLDAGSSSKGWSRIETIARCPQLYAYVHLLHLALGINSAPLVKGALGHIGAAHHYQRMQEHQQGGDPDRWYTPAEAIRLLASKPATTARDAGKDIAYWESFVEPMQRAVAAYIQRYGEDETSEILAVERVYSATIAKRFLYTQRLDLVVRDRDGKVRIRDHKFVASITRATTERYTLSGQFRGLENFGLAYYPDSFANVQINLVEISKGALEGASPHKFKRVALELAPFARKCHPQAVIDSEEDVARLAESGRDPWHYPKRMSEQICRTVYGDCPGKVLCQWGPSAVDKIADRIEEE